ncbi:MAG: Cytochrome c class, partial [Chthoniobacteraceae bacterium]|nr:Cytochrome c class [Chthoniobacteraceae bacterium]
MLPAMRHSYAAVYLLALASLVHAEEKPLAASVLPEAPGKSARGLTVTFTAAGKIDSRSARLLTLFVPKGEPVTPFLPAGPFTAKWEGEINSPLRAQYTFHAEVRGSFRLSVNGAVLLETVPGNQLQTISKALQLNKGATTILAEYSSDGSGDAAIQFKWSSKEFPIEPVPPTVFTHDINAKVLREGLRLREGRELFASLRCSACHGDPALIPPRGEGMPELAHDAPVFDELGAKYRETWLAHWINDPHSIRPHSLMPRVFSANPDQVDQRAADLAAFFASTGKADETEISADLAPLGGALFANLGCIACHTPPEYADKDEHDRTPLSHVKAKWQPQALRNYLKDPAKNYAWTHMPNSRLTNDETERLAAFLLSGTQREFRATPKGDAAQGAQLLVSSGCLNCHAGMPPTTQPPLVATLKNSWIKGCMAPTAAARGTAPDFNFTPQQRDALLAFGSTGFGSLKQDTKAEFAERQVTNMRCIACHARDGKSSTWAELEPDMGPLQAAAPAEEGEGHPAAGTAVPMLTWFGEKLQTPWMDSFIAGSGKYKPRPWIIARMPGFPTVSKGMAEGLAHQHGLPAAPELELPVDKEKAENGSKLISENGGFNCTTCHGVGDRPPTAVFEAPGINLAYSP